jgi:hypothetical protein
MDNSISEKEKEILYNLESDIKVLKKELNETVKAIVDGGYSKFPVIIAHADEIAIAQKVIDRSDHQTHFHFSASTLEEMVTREIVVKEREADFKQQFQGNSDKFCVLLVHPESMKFIFSDKSE